MKQQSWMVLLLLCTAVLGTTNNATATKTTTVVNITVATNETKPAPGPSKNVTLVEHIVPAALPIMVMIEPLQRNDSVASYNTTRAPCGGIIKGMSHLLVYPGASTLVQWKILTPAENGTCRIRLSNGIDDEQHFTTLFPDDKSADAAGKFECGRYAGAYETKTIILPPDMSCEKCTIQVMWESAAGTHYTCADVTVMNDKIRLCIGKCQNEGACVNGACVCNEPYFGEFCQYRNKDEVRVGYWWIVFLILLLVAAGFFVGAYFLNKNRGQGGEHPPIPFIEEPVEEQKPPPQEKRKQAPQVIEVMKDEEVVEEPQPPIQEEQHEEVAPERQAAIGDVCPNGHELLVSKSQVGCPGGYYMCANCQKVVQCSAGRWNCPTCNYDLCPECKPVEGAPVVDEQQEPESEQVQEQDQPREYERKPKHGQRAHHEAEDEPESEVKQSPEEEEPGRGHEPEPEYGQPQDREPAAEEQQPEEEPQHEPQAEPEEDKASAHGSVEATTPAGLGTDIKLVLQSKLSGAMLAFMKKGAKGRVTWNKTHFIFVLDCSGSMKGARWNSVKAGYKNCLAQLKKMPEVIVSAFTFDDKPNPFVREKTPAMAATTAERLPFSGKGTNYKRALEFVISIINKTQHPDYLNCVIFLSDGMGGYPEEALKEILAMRERGKKVAVYTIACVTKEDEDMIKMAKMLDGEHYSFENAESATKVFSAILRV